MPQTQKQSHYPDPANKEEIVSRTLSVLVDNEPGVLSRIAGLFSGRGYNIDSLTVTETEHAKHLSRFTIVTKGTPAVIEQIRKGKQQAAGAIVGAVMKETKGRADGAEVKAFNATPGLKPEKK